MQPEHVKYNEIEYDVIGIIDLNNGKFLILKNEENVIGLDMSNINSSFFNVSNIKKSTKVEVVLIEYILEAIRSSLKIGKYKNKEELKKNIVELNKYISTHPELLTNIKQLDFKDDIVDKTITSLLSYFDDVMKNASLNLDGITSFQVNGKSYIRYKDENDKVKIMEDNIENKNPIELKEVEDIKNLNIENPAEEKQKYDERQNKDIVGNSETGVFYDDFNEQTLTTEKNEGKEIISEVNEFTHTEYNDSITLINEQPSEIEYPPYNEDIVTQYLIANKSNKTNINDFIERYLCNFSIDQIDYLLKNYSLTKDQIVKLNTQRSSKLNLNQIKVQKENPKILVKKKDDKAAFVDTLLLSFIIGLMSGMYLVFLILIIMS